MARRNRSSLGSHILVEMSEGEPPKSKSRSVALAADKARMLRVERLKMTLDKRIENPFAAIDALMAEAAEGDPQTELWEKLHAAALRDGLEEGVADAYLKAIDGPRMRRLPAEAQADVVMHAADFFQGIRGDLVTAERLLARALEIAPDRVDAFTRLEPKREKPGDERRLLELYATVAATPPRDPKVLATQALNRVVMLSAKDPLPDDACRKLVALVATNARLLDALEAHCRTTKRPALACELIERGIAEDAAAPDALTAQRRGRLVELYFGEAEAPAKAIEHVEKLLERDPNDAAAFKAGERLLSNVEVASRAAAALQKARRARSG